MSFFDKVKSLFELGSSNLKDSDGVPTNGTRSNSSVEREQIISKFEWVELNNFSCFGKTKYTLNGIRIWGEKNYVFQLGTLLVLCEGENVFVAKGCLPDDSDFVPSQVLLHQSLSPRFLHCTHPLHIHASLYNEDGEGPTGYIFSIYDGRIKYKTRESLIAEFNEHTAAKNKREQDAAKAEMLIRENAN